MVRKPYTGDNSETTDYINQQKQHIHSGEYDRMISEEQQKYGLGKRQPTPTEIDSFGRNLGAQASQDYDSMWGRIYGALNGTTTPAEVLGANHGVDNSDIDLPMEPGHTMDPRLVGLNNSKLIR